MNRNYDWTYDFSFNELYVHFNGKDEGEKKVHFIEKFIRTINFTFSLQSYSFSSRRINVFFFP